MLPRQRDAIFFASSARSSGAVCSGLDVTPQGHGNRRMAMERRMRIGGTRHRARIA
ncbi:hypothetical protein [Xanthomonas bundabergensis]|uniref:hypothetical protein n=1 Tax=Xanthomonas bundabergensis TaxID=3160842 RepID=UPI0035195178